MSNKKKGSLVNGSGHENIHRHMHKFPAYSLPRLNGWHLLPKQDLKEKGKIFKYFGANWWDLLEDDKLPLHTGSIELDLHNYHATILVNLGSDEVIMTDESRGDTYHIPPGERVQINNNKGKKVMFSADDEECKIHRTQIGNMILVLLQVNQIKDGEALTKKSSVFTDFMLMSGVPDKEQYLNTVGIENLYYVETDGWKCYGDQGGIKSTFVQHLLDHWEKVSPRRNVLAENPIPEKVHWIWLRLDPHVEKYGKLQPKFYKFMDTWVKRNPEFEFNIWTDNPDFVVPKKYKDILNVHGPDEIEGLLNELPKSVRSNIKHMYYNHKNVGARSDTLRQVVLYFEGGIYSDVNDGACNAPLSKMFQKFDYMIGIEPVIYVNNAIIAAAPGHVITQSMIAWLAHNAEDFVVEWEEDYADADQESKDDYIVSTTGPIALSWVIFGVFEDENKADDLKDTTIMPSSWIYPNYFIAKEPGDWLKPTSICSHYDARDYLK